MSDKPYALKEEKPITLKTCISYGLGDTGDNICFATISSLLTLFYTDYVGISPATVALVMLISKFLDGGSDFVAGIVMDKTHSKYGKCRPWLLWVSVPFSISVVALFTVPQGSPTMQFWYIFIAYNFANTGCYTFSNLSQATMCSLMTRDSAQRERLGVWRVGMAPIGHILSSGLSLPLVKMLGDDQRAWIIVMSVWAVYALIVHLICFKNCPEQVQIEARDNAREVPLGRQLQALVSNRYWWWALGFWVFWATLFGVNGTTMSYYTKYILNDDTLYSTLFILEKLVWGFGMLVLVPMFRRKGFTKVKLLICGSTLAIIGHLLLLVAPTSIPVNYVTVVLRALGLAPSSALFNGMVADVVEYGQWKTHQRQESLIFSSSSMGNKIGSGIILSLITWLMSFAGFVTSTTGGTAQPQSALNMIHNLYIWAPIIIFGVLGIICAFNKLEGQLPEILEELKEREARGEL